MSERSITKDFTGLIGAALVLSVPIIPHAGELSSGLSVTALALRPNLALFLLAGGLAFLSASFNLVWGNRMQFPRFLYAGPFLTLLLGALIWAGYSAGGIALPEHGIASALQSVVPAVKASMEARILWVLMFMGALIGLQGGISNLKEDLMGRYGAVMALIVLFSISSEISPYFLQTRNILNILRQISYTGMIALGMTFVIISGGIDLSVGSLTALLGGVMIEVLNVCVRTFGDGVPTIVCALAAGIVLGCLSGLISGFMITKMRIAPFIVTLGTMAIYRSLALYISDAGEFRSSSALFPEIGMGNDPLLAIPYPVWTFLLLAVLCAVLLNRTRFGRYTSAIGSNEKVALYAAIRVERVRSLSYVLIGILTAVSAFLLAARLNSISSTNVGINFEMDAIAAVIIGGTLMNGGSGTVAGTVVGAIILGIVNNMLNMLGVSPYLQGTVKGIVIIVAVMIQRRRR